TTPDSRRRLFLASAIALPFLILSLAHSKLPHYLLPICPPVALLLAETLASAWDPTRPQRFGAAHFWIFGGLTFAFALVVLTPAWMDPEAISRRLGYDPGHPSHDVDLARIRRFQTPLPGAA